MVVDYTFGPPSAGKPENCSDQQQNVRERDSVPGACAPVSNHCKRLYAFGE